MNVLKGETQEAPQQSLSEYSGHSWLCGESTSHVTQLVTSLDTNHT